MVQQVIRLQNVAGHQLHAIQIAIFAVSHEQCGLFAVELVERRTQRFRLVRVKRPRIHNRQLLFRELRGKRRAQRAEEHLLRQRVTVIPRVLSMNRAAMAPERRTNRTDARAAGALLPPELAARAADFAFVLGLVRARAQTAQIPARSFVQQVRIHFRAKHCVGELHLPDLLAIQIDDVHDRHNFPYFAFLAVLARRIKMYAPLGPGTEPRTNSRFSSLSTFTTFKFLDVWFALPMCPGKCWFFHTREGNELPPMPPGARWPTFVSSFDSSMRTSCSTFMGATPAFLKCPVMALLTRCGLTNSTSPSCAAS